MEALLSQQYLDSHNCKKLQQCHHTLNQYRAITPYSSLVVDTEDDTSAEEWLVGVGEGGEVVVLLVPEALAGNADTLALSLTDNGLHNDLVRWYAQAFNRRLDFIGDSLSHILGMRVIILLVFQVVLDDLLDAGLDFWWIETVRLLWLKSIGVLVLRC